MPPKSLQSFELTHLEFKTIQLDLTRPFVTSVKTITQREIIVLRATICVDGETAVGYGEVAPLPGWSEASLADCLAVLDTIAHPVSLNSIEQLDESLPELSKFSTLRFGVELALLDALSRHQNMTISQLMAELFNPDKTGKLPTSIPLQNTVGALPLDELLEHAKKAQEEGYRYLKIKVGVGSLQEDIAKIAALCAFYPDLKLRLDANGAWSIAEALGITHAIARDFPVDGVDLIEQPVSQADFDDFLAQFSQQFEQRGASFKLAIAADESADSFEHCARLIEGGPMRAIVLKPSTLGGLIPSAKLIALAKSKGVRVVLSTLIESAIGRRGVAQLAGAFPDLAGPHGLATGSWFREDTAREGDRIEDAKLILNSAPGLGFEPTVEFPPTPSTRRTP